MPVETALITGASSGIGWELAELFARDKSNLVLVARRVDRLEELATRLRQQYGITVEVFAQDLSIPGAPDRVLDFTRGKGLEIDVLVNNAGFGTHGYFDEIPVERQVAMLQVNIVALTHLSRLYVPGMIARRRGHILNIGSTASFQPGPNLSTYYASKAYVLSFTHGLAEELSGTGVTATCLCPGPTETGFGEDSGMKNTLIFRMNLMGVKAVAATGYRAMRAGRGQVVPGLMNKVGAYFGSITPRWIVRKVTRRLQTLPPRSGR